MVSVKCPWAAQNDVDIKYFWAFVGFISKTP